MTGPATGSCGFAKTTRTGRSGRSWHASSAPASCSTESRWLFTQRIVEHCCRHASSRELERDSVHGAEGSLEAPARSESTDRGAKSNVVNIYLSPVKLLEPIHSVPNRKLMNAQLSPPRWGRAHFWGVSCAELDGDAGDLQRELADGRHRAGEHVDCEESCFPGRGRDEGREA